MRASTSSRSPTAARPPRISSSAAGRRPRATPRRPSPPAAAAVNSAQVELSNGATSRLKAVDLSAGTGARGWSAPFTQAELAELGDGTLTARLLVDDLPVGAAKTIRRNTVAPAPVGSTPAPATGGGSTAAAAMPVPRLAI